MRAGQTYVGINVLTPTQVREKPAFCHGGRGLVLIFDTPAWLLALPPLLFLVWRLGRTERHVSKDRRRKLQFLFRALGLAALVLTLADLRFPASHARVDVVAAVDVSDSIYDRAPQASSLKQLTARLTAASARVAVLAFGGNVVAERPLTRLHEPAVPATADLPPLPDLDRSRVVGTETDIGAALDRARRLFDPMASGRAIVLISDGQDTAGRAGERAAALRDSGIDLLVWPSTLGGTRDVVLAGLQLPDRAQQGRELAVQIAVEARHAARVRVRLGRKVLQGVEPVGAQDVTLAQKGRVFRATLRFVDRPKGPGVTVYVAALEGLDGNPLPGDYRQNNRLLGAVRVDGPSRWLAVARPGTTLAEWAKGGGEALGIEMTGVAPLQLPEAIESYAAFTGVIVGDVSAAELPDGAPAWKALDGAVENGLALVALGGEHAFGAGRHPEGGNWERLLPVTLRPEDDRTRTILFVLDTSATMAGQMAGRQEQKLAFACARLGELAQPGSTSALRPTDRVGLLAFAETPELEVPPDADPERKAFRGKLSGLPVKRQTNFLAALELARQTLERDDAEERLVIFVSDGEPTPAIPDEELEKAVRALCPGEGAKRRTRLHAFGIATGAADRNDQGEVRLKRMAEEGGGSFFPDFLKLDEGLRQVLSEQPSEFYVRREAFRVRSPVPQHPLLSAAGPWPELNFRNRFSTRPSSTVLLQSMPSGDQDGVRKADPLVVLGYHGTGSTAAVAMTIDGPAGRHFLLEGESRQGGQAFLAALLSWVERGDNKTWTAWRTETTEQRRRLRIRVEARHPESRSLWSGLRPTARLAPVFGERTASESAALRPVAPGTYEGELPLPGRDASSSDERDGIHRLEVSCEDLVVVTRYVSVPYPEEYRRFGTDRIALAEWVERAGGRSRILDVPDNLDGWLKEIDAQRAHVSARPVLLILAALALLAEVAVRGLRRRG